MNNVKSIFSIKDLENLSGIKAHTIRIWEKRYNILEPMRTDTNIRYYDLLSLQKLLNITLLHNHGYKISKISKYPNDRIPELVREIISTKSAKNHAINAFKLAMMNFDHALFFNTYNTLLADKTFREVFYEVIIPLMEEIGMLWQAETITPSHEHFISYLIKQKLLTNTEKVQINQPTKTNRVYVLYLPMNEIHELGLMYINHEILSKGYKTIYLGESVPFEDLKNVKKYFDNITFICYITVEPNPKEVNDYVEKVKKEILLENDDTSFWFAGRLVEQIDVNLIGDNVAVYTSIEELIDNVE
jgi:MerR family transcriptional regulator, light-induced transcriptional regulator